MAATYVFDVTAAEVKAEQIGYLQPVIDETVMEASIDEAASELNTILRALRIAPDSITAANAPDDYNWCRRTITTGAAGLYLRTKTGTWENGAGQRVEAMNARIQALRDMPQMLQSYNPDASSSATARSRTNYNPGTSTDQATQGARSRMLSPVSRHTWRQ